VSEIFSRNKVKLHRNSAAFSDKDYDFLFDYSAESIFSKLEDLSYCPQNILELGARRGSLSTILLKYYISANIFVTDIAEQAIRINPANYKIVADEEYFCFKENSFDLILSSLNLHWINDLPKFLFKIKKSLSDRGTFIASFIGGESLKDFRINLVKAELETEAPHIPHLSPMIEHDTITAILQKIGFKNIVTEKETVVVEYQNIYALMNDLKNMGESASFQNSYNYALRRDTINCLNYLYSKPFEEFFDIITLTVSK
jgi:SAM-dependent methyltransferase